MWRVTQPSLVSACLSQTGWRASTPSPVPPEMVTCTNHVNMSKFVLFHSWINFYTAVNLEGYRRPFLWYFIIFYAPSSLLVDEFWSGEEWVYERELKWIYPIWIRLPVVSYRFRWDGMENWNENKHCHNHCLVVSVVFISREKSSSLRVRGGRWPFFPIIFQFLSFISSPSNSIKYWCRVCFIDCHFIVFMLKWSSALRRMSPSTPWTQLPVTIRSHLCQWTMCIHLYLVCSEGVGHLARSSDDVFYGQRGQVEWP